MEEVKWGAKNEWKIWVLRFILLAHSSSFQSYIEKFLDFFSVDRTFHLYVHPFYKTSEQKKSVCQTFYKIRDETGLFFQKCDLNRNY